MRHGLHISFSFFLPVVMRKTLNDKKSLNNQIYYVLDNNENQVQQNICTDTASICTEKETHIQEQLFHVLLVTRQEFRTPQDTTQRTSVQLLTTPPKGGTQLCDTELEEFTSQGQFEKKEYIKNSVCNPSFARNEYCRILFSNRVSICASEKKRKHFKSVSRHYIKVSKSLC